MATFGYVRVSTQDQNIARQMSALNGLVEPDNILIEKISGKDINRPQLQRLLNDKLRAGDTLVIKSIDRP